MCTAAPGDTFSSVSRSRSLTTVLANAACTARASNADRHRASRSKTHDFGNRASAANAFHFAESTSTMSSTNGMPASGGSRLSGATPEQ